MTTCTDIDYATGDHDFTIARANYFKEDGKENYLGKTYNQSKTYSTLYCKRCGKTKEILVSDQTKEKNDT